VGTRLCLDRYGKSRPPPGFDPWTVQPVASRYTDHATQPSDTKVTKVKCTRVQALMHCTARTAHRMGRGIALLFHDHGTRRG